MTLTTPTHYERSIVWALRPGNAPPDRKLPEKKQKWSPYKVKGPFSVLVCTRRWRSGTPSADQAISIASCNSRHALSARAVHPPTSPCPTLSASAEPIFKTGHSKRRNGKWEMRNGKRGNGEMERQHVRTVECTCCAKQLKS